MKTRTTPRRPDLDIEADPYSWAMARIVPTLTKALERDGTMSASEFNTLQRLRDVIEDHDPDALNLEAKAIIIRR